jgi:hypothetical protein
MLGVPVAYEYAEAMTKTITLTKQAQLPIEVFVKNWDEVVAWGYGGGLTSAAWQDIFANSS